MKKIVLAGGTGNIGELLTPILINLDYEVVILSRKAINSNHKNIKYVQWDGESQGDWTSELEGVDTIINLSGKSIQCRFTEANKNELLASRIKPTKILGEVIQELQDPPRLWINFSGISVFEGLENKSDENSQHFADTFLANLSKKWENTFFESTTRNTKKVCLRLSPVLSKNFGMFKELYFLSKIGLGGRVGSGKQMIAWIHDLDLIRMVIWIINHHSPSSLYHACSPNPISNKDFIRNLRNAVGMPIGFPLPTFLAKIATFVKGVESDMILLDNYVSTTKTIEEGFVFDYSTTQEAFEHLTKK